MLVTLCYIDGQKNKYSALNECNRILKYNILFLLHLEGLFSIFVSIKNPQAEGKVVAIDVNRKFFFLFPVIPFYLQSVLVHSANCINSV
jgi:hypothetical protein